jgi:hypothetical protein
LVEDDALRRVRADGRRREVILREAELPGATESSSLTAHPAWSPRGDWIAFIASPAPGDSAVYLVRPDGSRLRRVLALGRWGFRQETVVWSPDGRHLAATVVDSLNSSSIAISDVVVVEVASGKTRRVTRGWRYGSENVALQWHPRAFPTSRLPGTPTGWTLPSDTIVEPTMLETTRVVDRLAADGSRVTFTFVPPTYSGYRGRALYRSSGLNCAELWQPGAAPIRLREPCSGTPWGPQGIAVAGEHVAWVESLLGPNAGSNSFSVYAGTAALPAPRLVLQTGNDPTGDLLGDADLLVFATWARNGFCTGSGCYVGERREGRLYRFDGRAATLIAASTGPLTPLSVDRGRILVDRGTGLLDLLSADGASRRTFELNASLVRGARLQGRNLVVLTPSVVEVTDTDTGSFLRRWPAPSNSARLEDVQDEIAVLVAGPEIHLLRLSDGRVATIEVPGRGPVRAQLEPDGLFYSYGVDDPKYPGRVGFLPIDQLPLR